MENTSFVKFLFLTKFVHPLPARLRIFNKTRPSTSIHPNIVKAVSLSLCLCLCIDSAMRFERIESDRKRMPVTMMDKKGGRKGEKDGKERAGRK